MNELRAQYIGLSNQIEPLLGFSRYCRPENLEYIDNNDNDVTVYKHDIPSWITTTKGERPYSKYASLYGHDTYTRTEIFMPGSSAYEDEREITEHYSYLVARYLID